jgi:hypothetical protein
MPELGQLLDDLAGPQPSAEPHAVKARVDERRRRRQLGRLAIALTAVLVIASVTAFVVREEDKGPQSLNVVNVGPTGQWTRLPAGPADSRSSASVVWTGEELIVWGGEVQSDSDALNTGAAFSPSTGTWRELPRAPILGRSGHAAVWTGNEMIVCCGGADPSGSIAAYNPANDSWRLLQAQSELEPVRYPGAVWTGDAMIVAGGVFTDAAQNGALQYDPVSDRWQGIRELSPVTIERSPDVGWTGSEMIVVPRDRTADPPAAFDPRSGTWRAFPQAPSALAIDHPSAVWTGQDLLLWGVSRGADASGTYRAVGARLDPASGTWSPIADAPLAPIDWWNGTAGSNSAVWDASHNRMIVYTGAIATGRTAATDTPVLAYYPAQDSWQVLPSLPTAYHHPTLTIADGRLIANLGSFYSLDLSSVEDVSPQDTASMTQDLTTTVTAAPSTDATNPGEGRGTSSTTP